jgi:hypothetical protein
MPDPTLLKLVTAANSLMIGVVALVILACLAILLVALCLVVIRLRRILRQPPATGEIVTDPEPDIVEGVFVDSVSVDASVLALSQHVYTR